MVVLDRVLEGRTAPLADYPELKELLARIARACTPLDIILYGSRARGDATAMSDWDIKVVVPDTAPDALFSPLFGWRLQEGSGVYADVSFVRRSDFDADLAVANSAASHILQDGIVLDVG